VPEVILQYGDGRTVRVERKLGSLADAIALAIDLADRAGHFVGDGHGPPKYVKVYRGGFLELAIAVIRGGLLTPSDTRQSRPT